MTFKLLLFVALGYGIGNPTWTEVGYVVAAILMAGVLALRVRRLLPRRPVKQDYEHLVSIRRAAATDYRQQLRRVK